MTTVQLQTIFHTRDKDLIVEDVIDMVLLVQFLFFAKSRGVGIIKKKYKEIKGMQGAGKT